MPALKNNINTISDDTEAFVKDYMKLLMIKLTEKTSMFLGVLASVFIISLLMLVVIVFCSIALSGYLNKVLDSEFWGYGIVGGVYILAIGLLIRRIVKSQTPLLTNLLVRFLVFALDIDVSQPNNLKGLQREHELINEKLDSGKVKIKADVQLLKYSFMEGLLKGFTGLFLGKKKKTKAKPDPGAKSKPKAKPKAKPRARAKAKPKAKAKGKED